MSFLASLFSIPVRLDSATACFKRPSVALIQVDIDLLKPLLHRLWIGTGDNGGISQKFKPDENLPSYCQYCYHVGHSEDICIVKHPELKAPAPPPPKPKSVPKPIIRQEYRPIAKPVTDSEPHISVSLPSPQSLAKPIFNSQPQVQDPIVLSDPLQPARSELVAAVDVSVATQDSASIESLHIPIMEVALPVTSTSRSVPPSSKHLLLLDPDPLPPVHRKSRSVTDTSLPSIWLFFLGLLAQY